MFLFISYKGKYFQNMIMGTFDHVTIWYKTIHASKPSNLSFYSGIVLKIKFLLLITEEIAGKSDKTVTELEPNVLFVLIKMKMSSAVCTIKCNGISWSLSS